MTGWCPSHAHHNLIWLKNVSFWPKVCQSPEEAQFWQVIVLAFWGIKKLKEEGAKCPVPLGLCTRPFEDWTRLCSLGSAFAGTSPTLRSWWKLGGRLVRFWMSCTEARIPVWSLPNCLTLGTFLTSAEPWIFVWELGHDHACLIELLAKMKKYFAQYLEYYQSTGIFPVNVGSFLPSHAKGKLLASRTKTPWAGPRGKLWLVWGQAVQKRQKWLLRPKATAPNSAAFQLLSGQHSYYLGVRSLALDLVFLSLGDGPNCPPHAHGEPSKLRESAVVHEQSLCASPVSMADNNQLLNKEIDK